MEERLILVTNDDGYDSRGMEAAVENFRNRERKGKARIPGAAG